MRVLVQPIRERDIRVEVERQVVPAGIFEHQIFEVRFVDTERSWASGHDRPSAFVPGSSPG